MVRGLVQGALMLVFGALITWVVAVALQDRAIVRDDAAVEKPAPGLAATPSPTSHWMF